MIAQCFFALAAFLPLQTADVTPAGTIQDGLVYPARLAAAPGGGLYVTDPPKERVLQYDPAGTLVGTFTIAEGPLGIGVHPTSGNIYVSRLDGVVGIYDATFTQTGSLDPSPFTLVSPNDIAVHPVTGEVYVTDAGRHQVFVFDGGTGTLVRMWGSEGQGLAQIESVQAIALDPALERVIVADTDNFRIQVFDTAGVLQFKFGYRTAYTDGGVVAWVPRSTGVDVDSCGNIYVADALMGTVRIFSPSGTDLDINTPPVGYGTNPGELRVPGDLLIDGSTLYVASTNNSSVELYDITCSPAFKSGGAPPPNQPVRADPLGLLTGRMPPMPDNPFDIVEAMRSGTYDRALDLNRDRKVDMRDLEISVAHFGGATIDDFLRDASGPLDGDHPFDEPPHMHFHEPPMPQYPWICSRCHNMTGAPGDMLTDWGQENLCLSCHSGARQAGALPIGGDGKGNNHPWAVPAAGGDVPGPAAGSDLSLHLDGGDIRCGTCHDPHTSGVGGPYLRVNNDTGGLCMECHRGETAPANHGDSTTLAVCGECHDPHAEGTNLGLFREQVGAVDVVFDDDSVGTGPGAFVDPDPGVFGPCEACHPFPEGVPPHTLDPPMAPCVQCHPHSAGFMPSGGSCVDCHSGPQDNGDGIPPSGRRGAASEFPTGDFHAHYGADVEDGCTVCHDQSTHMDGYVDLIDPDDGSVYRFVEKEDLTSDPDLSNFCADCHDADGAARLADPLDPFGGGNVPPDVKERFQGTLQWNEWYGDICFGEEGTLRGVTSHHDISDADQAFSGAKLECLNCHGAHSSSASQPTGDPFDPNSPWPGDMNGFCLTCHAGGNGPTDPLLPPGVTGPAVAMRGIDSCDYTGDPWYVDYSWTHVAHGMDSKRPWPGYSGAPEYELSCTDCHDPHGSYTPANAEGNPYMIRDHVDGTMYVDDGTRTGGFNGPPWNTFGTERDVVIPVSGTDVGWGGPTGLCEACHADWLLAYDFHDFCTGCQTCHGHGQAFGNTDWGPVPDDSQPCPIPLEMKRGPRGGEIPIHFHKPGPADPGEENK